MEKISILFWFSNKHEALEVTQIIVPLRYMFAFAAGWTDKFGCADTALSDKREKNSLSKL